MRMLAVAEDVGTCGEQGSVSGGTLVGLTASGIFICIKDAETVVKQSRQLIKPEQNIAVITAADGKTSYGKIQSKYIGMNTVSNNKTPYTVLNKLYFFRNCTIINHNPNIDKNEIILPNSVAIETVCTVIR